MKYISTVTWRDNTDGHLYVEGEPFPFDGREIPKERLEALESGRNRAGLRLIRAVEFQDEPEEARKEEAPETASEARKTAPATKAGTDTGRGATGAGKAAGRAALADGKPEAGKTPKAAETAAPGTGTKAAARKTGAAAARKTGSARAKK